MTDISKCSGEDCAIRERCFRFTAAKAEWQSWIAGKFDPDTKSCPSFLEEQKGLTDDELHAERLKLIHELEAENTRLRAMLARSDADCAYCGLSKADMSKCSKGFPGCGRADDIVLSED